MNRIEKLFASHGRGEIEHKILSAYIMPSYPHTESTFRLIAGAERAGANLVELGVPFSDPLADGPVIQKASQVSITNGTTPRSILAAVKEIRKRTDIPIVLMGYYNSFMNGIGDDFPADIRESGADGLIIPDLSLEESQDVKKNAEAAGLGVTFLIAPTSDDDRIMTISSASTYFSYCVSVTGVTGARQNLVSEDVLRFLGRVRKKSAKPFVVGFGISTPETAREISRYSDGIVVGSALLQRVSEAQSGEEEKCAYEFLKTLRAAIDR